MLTAADISKLIESFSTIFVTRQEFEDFREESRQRFDQVSTTMDQISTSMDSVLTEVKAMREEQSFHQQQHRDMESELGALKGRVEKIEGVPAVAHELKQ